MNRNTSSNNAYQNTDYGLVTPITNSSRMGKQTASGDTGDNTACEQAKRSLTEDSPTTNNYSKALYTHPTTPNMTTPNHLTNTPQTGVPGCSTPRFNGSNTVSPSGTAENKTNLIINYLPPNMSQEEVRALFSSVGEVESCKLVREKTSGESLGYAFVKFYDPVDAGKAIKTLNGLRLQNKTVKVSLARPSSEAIKGANLYICGLPRKMTQAELEKLFGTCGHIITARILYDTKTGLSRGVAFIRYDQRTEAEVAIRKLNGYLPPGATEQITVKFANSPSSNRTDIPNMYMRTMEDTSARYAVASNGTTFMDTPATTRPMNATNGSQSGQSPSGHNINDAGVKGNQANLKFMLQSQQLTGNPGSNGICGANSSYAVSTDTNPNAAMESQPTCPPNPLLTHNFPVPLPPTGPHVRPDPSINNTFNRFSSNARFKCHAAAVAAAALSNGGVMGMRSPNGIINGHIAPNFPTGLPAFGMDFMRNLAPNAQALLAPAFAASSGALTATGWCIFVYNLAPDTEDSVLWQLFGPFGAVQTVKVVRDPVTGKCKGFGFVTMSNYEEALLAIHSLNGFNLGNRVLQVSFKTTPNARQIKYMANSPPEVTPLLANMHGSTTPVPGTLSKNA